MIAFAATNLTPDTQQFVAWLIREALAWLQSATPAQLAVGVWAASLGIAAVVVLGVRRWGLR